MRLRRECSVERLSKTAEALASALETLGRESEAVAAALQETSAEIHAKAEIGAILRRASSALAEVQSAVPLDEAIEDPAGLLAAIFRKYTMVREREVHARILKGDLPAMAEAPASGGGDDDIFF